MICQYKLQICIDFERFLFKKNLNCIKTLSRYVSLNYQTKVYKGNKRSVLRRQFWETNRNIKKLMYCFIREKHKINEKHFFFLTTMCVSLYVV